MDTSISIIVTFMHEITDTRFTPKSFVKQLSDIFARILDIVQKLNLVHQVTEFE